MGQQMCQQESVCCSAETCKVDIDKLADGAPMEGPADAECPQCPPSDASGSASYLEEGAQLGGLFSVDAETVRFVSLASTLQSGGWMWRVRPEKMNHTELLSLWARSTQTDAFDVFVSHTWSTPGHCKYLSLLLSSCWHYALAAWLATAVPLLFLYWNRALPLVAIYPTTFDSFELRVPYWPWIQPATFLAAAAALFLAPHCILHRFFTTRCFYDVVCVNQADPWEQRQGINSIAGLLAASKQLRILWSPSYLSRLWCVFEIAAYRKANPHGELRFQPLFVERDILVLWTCGFLAAVLFSAMLSSFTYSSVLLGAILCLVFLPGAHFVRRGYREQDLLLRNLAEFDLSAVSCACDFDRQFILSAVRSWYGSTDAFVEYVRGPIREELVETMQQSRVPFQYCILALSPIFGFQLDVFGALINARAPQNIAIKFLGQSITILAVAVWGVRLFFWLSQKMAQPIFKLDFLQTALVVLIWAVMQVIPFWSVLRAFQTDEGGVAAAAVVFTLLAASRLPACKTMLSKVIRISGAQGKMRTSSSG
ncbi:unnamed protein product [Symbiodinium natans]|uniref:Uncharacterized protein n=1 Tax=Symbiodinium natans TaxID=878477 RepID=A0A812NCK1_9DINO|nr:unnamed protein product [Symbiodinium natans]